MRAELPKVLERPLEVAPVLDLDPEVFLVLAVPLREPNGMLKVASLATDADGRLKVERRLFGRRARAVGEEDRRCGSFRGGRGVDEGGEGRVVGELGVAVEKEGGVVRVGETAGVELLEVRGEVRESLGVEELAGSMSSVQARVW